MISGPKELAWRPAPKGTGQVLGENQYAENGLEFGGAVIEKGGMPERAAPKRKKPLAS